MKKKISSQKKSDGEIKAPLKYSRREAVKALTKYSAALGGAAMVVVTAEGLVSEASAYGQKKKQTHGGWKKWRRMRRMRRVRRIRRVRRMWNRRKWRV